MTSEPAVSCLTCKAESTPGQLPILRHVPGCAAERDQFVETALAAIQEYRDCVWAWQDTGSTLEGAGLPISAADVLAARTAALAGYARRLAATKTRPGSITATATIQGEPDQIRDTADRTLLS